MLAAPANAAEWQAQDLEPGSEPADVAIDGDGNAVAVWTENKNTSPVRVSFRPAGAHFEAPRTLDGCGGIFPAVDVDAQGNFTVLWVSCSGTVQAVTGDGTGFDPPVTVAPAPAGGEGRAYPDLDIAPTGAAVAAWQTTGKDDAGKNKTRAEAALRAAGGAWAPSETISPGPLAPWTLTMSDNIDVGIDSGGRAAVLFRRWRLDEEPWGNPQQMLGSEPNYKIDQVVVGRVGEGFHEPRTIDEGGELQSPRLAVGSDGQTLISWIVSGTSEAIGVIAGTTADPLAGDPYEAFRSPDQDNSNPVPHIDGAGRAYIVFERHGTALVEALDVNGPWGPPESVTSAEPALFNSAVSEAGEIVVAAYSDGATSVHLRLAEAGDFLHSQPYERGPGMATAVNAGRAAALWTERAVVYDGPAPAPADTRAPRCEVDNFRQNAGGGFSFDAECDEAADLSTTLAIRAAKRTKLGALTAHVRAGRARTLRLRTGSKGRRALARAAARRDWVVVRLILSATDAAGNSRVVRRRTAILAGE
jgi:hypothetical protein